jgi:hypothetical protein
MASAAASTAERAFSITGRRAAYSLLRYNSSHKGPTLTESYPAAPVICCGCDCAWSCWAEAASGVCRYKTISDCLKYRRASASKGLATASLDSGKKVLEKLGKGDGDPRTISQRMQRSKRLAEVLSRTRTLYRNKNGISLTFVDQY